MQHEAPQKDAADDSDQDRSVGLLMRGGTGRTQRQQTERESTVGEFDL